MQSVQFQSYNLLAQVVGPVQPGSDVTYPNNSLGSVNVTSWVSLAIPLLIIVLILGLIALGVYLYLQFLKHKDRDEKSKNGVLMEVKVTRDNETEIGVAEQMFANLYGIGGVGKGLDKWFTVPNSISFEIVGLPGEIRFYVHASKKLADLVEKQILGSYQDAEVTIVDEHNIFNENSKVAFASLTQTDEPYYPIKVSEDFTGDPLANILSTLSKMQEGEGALVQIVISPAGSKWQKNGRKFVSKVEETNSDPEKKRIGVSQEQLQAISKKTSKIAFNTSIRIVATASNEDIANMHLNNIVGAFDQFSNPGINELKKEKLDKLKGHEFMNEVIFRKPSLKKGAILNVEELAGMYHFPNKNVTTPNINWLLSKEAPAANWISSEVGSKDTIWLGNNIYRGQSKKICFKRDDRRRHSYVLGQTGSGKSWLLVRMMMQDI
ncbi:MAG TPA: hypothetical protein VHA74_02345, partial [Candidatus Dojkabacteria bacterium]|nr:hypothetical protein [Candidatus Dojkabacteria bacterium]